MAACGGWGAAWGDIPWGGNVCPPTDTGTGIVPGWGRYERVSRYEQREQREERNVWIVIDGVQAKAIIGKATVEIRRPPPIPPPAPKVLDGDVRTFVIPRALTCECGAVKVSASCKVYSEGVAASTDVGAPQIQGIRNPTDEELLMMLAEIAEMV